ncbi:MAG: molecular chaperone HtpG [Candidatus Cloacimonetes bacterium]|nr:molecular chaperone HtpG [Candidatus Cloacimonadota bacterium]
MADKKQGNLSIHTENIFPIIKKWLYSEHDIFLRELISNAVDAMNKRKLVDANVNIEDLKINIEVDKKKKTIKIIDRGIGMTADEIEKYINQIAFSGAEDFVDKFKDKQDKIIGQFGLGFYSSFMISNKVTIDSLSYKEGETPTYWECEGDTEYTAGAGKNKNVGTIITMHVNEDNEDYLNESEIKKLVQKYSNFMPFPIYVGKDEESANQQEALWDKKPKDVTDEEYKAFYKQLFNEWEDPLFWIHLNVDFPFNLKGILYFPKIKNEVELNRGKVKLFCNNVFVADDLKGIIPEFMLMLKGGIDIPDIPLNVSRSFLQEDKQVQKISSYIIKKIADSLKGIFKEDRKKYETLWNDINHFIKYGIITDEKFSDSMKDHVIFKTSNDDYVTVEDYLGRNNSDEKPQKIYYASNEESQVTHLNMMKEHGIEVIFGNSIIDNHIFQHLESKIDNISFVRVDSEVNDLLVDNDKKENSDHKNITANIKEIFNKNLNEKIEANFNKENYAKLIKEHPVIVEKLNPYLTIKDDFTYIKPYEIPSEIRDEIGQKAYDAIMEQVFFKITTKPKYLKSINVPAMVVVNEHMRRFSEMNSMMVGGGDMDMFSNHDLIINPENNTIQHILKFADEGRDEDVNLLCKYVHDLALLSQKQFTGNQLNDFLNRSNKVLGLIK